MLSPSNLIGEDYTFTFSAKQTTLLTSALALCTNLAQATKEPETAEWAMQIADLRYSIVAQTFARSRNN